MVNVSKIRKDYLEKRLVDIDNFEEHIFKIKENAMLPEFTKILKDERFRAEQLLKFLNIEGSEDLIEELCKAVHGKIKSPHE